MITSIVFRTRSRRKPNQHTRREIVTRRWRVILFLFIPIFLENIGTTWEWGDIE